MLCLILGNYVLYILGSSVSSSNDIISLRCFLVHACNSFLQKLSSLNPTVKASEVPENALAI